MSVSDGIKAFFRTMTARTGTGAAETRDLNDVETSRIRFAASLAITGFAAAVVASIKPWGPTTAYLITFLYLGLVAAYAALRRDGLLGRVLLACAIAGFLELYSDWYIIEAVPTLRYAEGGPFVASSPFYMPFSWTVVLFMFSLVARWLDRRYGLLVAILVSLLIGLANLPVYEFLAAGAGWWRYHDVPAIGNAPFYLIAGEPLIIASLPLVARAVEKRGLLASLAAGLALGIWIYAAIRIGLALFG